MGEAGWAGPGESGAGHAVPLTDHEGIIIYNHQKLSRRHTVYEVYSFMSGNNF